MAPEHKRTVVFFLSHFLFMAGGIVFVVAFVLPHWAEFEHGNAGLWEECIASRCEAMEIFDGVRFLGGTRMVCIFILFFMAVAVLADAFERCEPKEEGPRAYVCRRRLKEIAIAIASVLCVLAAAIYGLSFEDYYGKSRGRMGGSSPIDPSWGASLIMVVIVPFVWLLALVLMLWSKDIRVPRMNKVDAVVYKPSKPADEAADGKPHEAAAVGHPPYEDQAKLHSENTAHEMSPVAHERPVTSTGVKLGQEPPQPQQPHHPEQQPQQQEHQEQPQQRQEEEELEQQRSLAHLPPLQTSSRQEDDPTAVASDPNGADQAEQSQHPPWHTSGKSRSGKKRGTWGGSHGRAEGAPDGVYTYTTGGEHPVPHYTVYEERLEPRESSS